MQKRGQFAASLQKRFAPVVCRGVDDQLIPEAISRLNFIFLDDNAKYDERLDQLARALTTDIDWIRKHTEFGELALRWSQAGQLRPKGLLLRSPSLEEAERWISSRPPGAPHATDATHEFIAESRRVETQRRQVLVISLSAGLVLALILAGVAFWQRIVAIGNEKIARHEEEIAKENESKALAALSRVATNEGSSSRGIALALAALQRVAVERRAEVGPATESLAAALSKLPPTISELSHPDVVTGALWPADDDKMCTWSMDRRLRAWNLKTNKLLFTTKPEDTNIRGGIVTPDHQRVILWCGNYIRALDAATGATVGAANEESR
jgi:hypothetical protein